MMRNIKKEKVHALFCVLAAECSSSRECISDQLCIQGVCQPTCRSNDSCPAFQFCQNSICVQEVRCRTDYDCSDTEKCRENAVGQAECLNACDGPVACGRNAECTAQHHEPLCTCKPGYHGNPRDDKIGCQPIECQTSEQCSNDKFCEEYTCKIACLVKNPCGINALCSAQNHEQVPEIFIATIIINTLLLLFLFRCWFCWLNHIYHLYVGKLSCIPDCWWDLALSGEGN